MHGWMAERSKAPVSGTGLFGGVGSNPTPIILFFITINGEFLKKCISVRVDGEHGWMAERSKAPV